MILIMQQCAGFVTGLNNICKICKLSSIEYKVMAATKSCFDFTKKEKADRVRHADIMMQLSYGKALQKIILK